MGFQRPAGLPCPSPDAHINVSSNLPRAELPDFDTCYEHDHPKEAESMLQDYCLDRNNALFLWY